MPPIIRDAGPADEAAFRRLWAGYTAFYRVDVAADVTEATWARCLDPASPLGMRVAERDGTLAGFAIRVIHAATWVKEPVCYLEDLFVDDAARGRGLGRALIDDLVGLCRSNGWSRLYWHTDAENHRAQALYDTYVKSDGHIRYRMAF